MKHTYVLEISKEHKETMQKIKDLLPKDPREAIGLLHLLSEFIQESVEVEIYDFNKWIISKEEVRE